MKILCLVKFTPDVDAFAYDYENHVLVRENVKQIINPDDACALGFALRLKKRFSEIYIEVVTMAPLSVIKLVEDILRRNVDQATILSDPQFGGSDTLATSFIIGTYLKNTEYDVILTGSHTLDGDTAHVPAQLADFLNLDHMSDITKIDEETFLKGSPLVNVDTEKYAETYEIPFPAILSVCRESKYKLPFVRFADLDLDVQDRIRVVDREALGLQKEQTGNAGSATKVVRTFTKTYEEKKEQVIVKNDKEGIEVVYQFLKEQGYLV